MKEPTTSAGRNLRQLRERLGLTQAELGALVGTGKSQINKLELGTRPLRGKWPARLAHALGCDPLAISDLDHENFVALPELGPKSPVLDSDQAGAMTAQLLFQITTDIKKMQVQHMDAMGEYAGDIKGAIDEQNRILKNLTLTIANLAEQLPGPKPRAGGRRSKP